MTSQITDKFTYQDEEYRLIGFEGNHLFSPEDYGMTPVMMHTACYRGFYSTYEIYKEAIFLRKLVIRTEGNKYCGIDGVKPVKDDYQASYTGLNLKVPFSGTLRLAKDFIEELYVHMGYQKPSAFKTVIDFQFTNGSITQIQDRSQEVAKIRGEFKKSFEGNGGMTSILEAFGQGLELK